MQTSLCRTLLLAMLLSTPVTPAQMPKVLDVEVTDDHLEPVRALKVSDFEVRAGSEKYNLDKVYYGDAVPTDLVIAIQQRRTVLEAFPQIREALRENIESLPASSRIALIGFGQASKTYAPLLADRQEVERQLEMLLAAAYQNSNQDTNSKAYEAIIDGTKILAEGVGPARRRAIIIVTEESETSSKIKFEALMHTLETANATVIAVIAHRNSPSRTGGIPPYVNVPPKPIDGKDLENYAKRIHRAKLAIVSPIAAHSGGFAIDSADDNAATEIDHLFARIQHRYLLLFSGDKIADKGSKTIRVNLRDFTLASKTTLRYRNGK